MGTINPVWRVDNSLKLLFLLNIMDISLTKYLTGLGARELNPIINYLLSINFLWAFLFKVTAIGAFMCMVIALRGRVKGIRPMVMGMNIFFVLLVLYQLMGVLVLS